MGIITAHNLSLRLGGKTILNKLNLDLWEGHVHAIVGPNGAGKSSFSFTVMGLSGYRDYEGELLYRGNPLRPLSIDERARQGITLGWQEPARFEGLSINSFLSAAAADKSPDTVTAALEKVGLSPDDYLSRAVDRTLSGGERKRVELASLLVMKPRIVLLDEPDSGID
ncbi:MAG TPA: ATP-binding cassette domain-containing protein, partial [Spirochaetes bacterium]|nr:ATP-binding cassette domain-containing protein [Spirochaetota bacterium]